MPVENYSFDNLLAADDYVTDTGVLISGQNLQRGALLGRITTGGKLNLSLSAAADGSQTPFAILAEDTDATGGDKPCIYYLFGEFNANQMTFGTAHTLASTKNALRALGIFLKTAVPQ